MGFKKGYTVYTGLPAYIPLQGGHVHRRITTVESHRAWSCGQHNSARMQLLCCRLGVVRAPYNDDTSAHSDRLTARGDVGSETAVSISSARGAVPRLLWRVCDCPPRGDGPCSRFGNAVMRRLRAKRRGRRHVNLAVTQRLKNTVTGGCAQETGGRSGIY